MANLNFLKLPFFRRPYNIATTLNKKLAKSLSVLVLALLSVIFSLVCVAFIFFAGLQKYIPEVLFSHSDIQNLFISIVLTFSSLFAIFYTSFYIDKKRYDGKIVAPAIVSVILFTINLFLSWRCYFSNDLGMLSSILASGGVMLSIFMIFLSILQYDVVSKKTSKRHFASTTVRTLPIVCLVLYLFAFFTDIDYLSHFLTMVARISLSGVQTGAIVLFSFMIADICMIITIIMMMVVEHRLNVMLKDFTSKLRNKNLK